MEHVGAAARELARLGSARRRSFRVPDSAPFRWIASDQGILETLEHEGGQSLLTQSRDGRIRLWDLQRMAEGSRPEDGLTRTLRTECFFFTKCAVAKRSDCAFRYAPPPPRETARPDRPPAPKPTSGIGACLDLADDDDDGDDGGGPNDDGSGECHWSGRPGAPSHLVLAPTEPPEAMLLWDTRCPEHCAKLHPDAGDRSRVGQDGTSTPVLGMAMSTKLWLPYDGCTSGTPPLALVGHENGDVLAWDLSMMRPRIWSKTPPGLFKSPLMGLDVNRNGTVMFCGGIEASARTCAVLPGTIKPRHAVQLPVSCTAVHELDRHEGLGHLAVRPDGRVVATAGWDYRVRLFSAKPPKYKALAVLKYHDAAVNALDFSDDSKLLVTGSKDQKLAVWKVFPPKPDPEPGARLGPA